MAEPAVYILSGGIRSGKTTRLLEWSARRKDVSGILTPVINGARFFLNPNTGEQFAMEAGCKQQNVIEIGKYIFDRGSFQRAIEIVRSAIGKNGWLVLDEIGPLELRGQGFHDVIKEILDDTNERPGIVFVVRDPIIASVVDHFQLDKRTVSVVDISDPVFQQ